MFQMILGILALVSAIWVIYDVFTKNKKVKKELKLVWAICAILFSIVTAIVYFFMYKYK